MDGVCRVSGTGLDVRAACSRCEAVGCPWDRIGGKPICPDCQELLALGVCDPLVEPLVQRCCAICTRRGTAPYLTFPLHATDPPWALGGRAAVVIAGNWLMLPGITDAMLDLMFSPCCSKS